MLVYSIFQLPCWFFFLGGLECKRFGSLKRAAGGTTFRSARLHPRLVASRVRSPGVVFSAVSVGPWLSFRSFGPCCRMFFFVLNKFPRRFCFVRWFAIFAAFPVDVVRSFSWKFVLGRKEVVGPKCLLFKININFGCDGGWHLFTWNSRVLHQCSKMKQNGNRMEANCAFFPFKQQEKMEGIIRQDCVISCEEIENSEDMEKFYKPS